MAASENAKWLRASIALVVATVSASVAVSVLIFRRKSRGLRSKVRELETSLRASLEKCASERQGRVRSQKALREALTQVTKRSSDKLKLVSYPMTPIAVVQSCFTTRNGTPRQPLLVPLARACLIFDSGRVPPAALEGLGEYSHCWILYVFHLNTDLEKLWKQPAQSKFKAKVRVPRLKGCKMGVFATRSPHRLCPIGLTVAKVEAVQGRMVLLSGVDLVDGTLYLMSNLIYHIATASRKQQVPKWVMEDKLLAVASINFSQEFSSCLADCWVTAVNASLYASPDEFQSLIKQVLSWDIRSVSQRNRPHNVIECCSSDLEGDEVSNSEGRQFLSSDITYHLTLEGLDISYRIDTDGNVMVEKASLSPEGHNCIRNRCNYMLWRDGNG